MALAYIMGLWEFESKRELSIIKLEGFA